MNKQITEQNISDVISKLAKERTLVPIEISDIMSSNELNTSFNYIEQELNNLYDSIRMLEQLGNYTKEYVTQQIETKENQFKEYLKMIEDVADLYQDTNSVSYLIQFLASKDTIRDRDGSIIPQMDITNHHLEMPGTILAKANLNNITHVSDIDCYNNSYHNLLNEQPGVSIYFSDVSLLGGLMEDVSATISNPQLYNYININVTNADIHNPAIVNDAVNIPIKIEESSYMTPSIISGLIFTLNCTAYNIGKKAITLEPPNTEIPFDPLPILDGNTNKEKEIENNTIKKENQTKDINETPVNSDTITGTGEYVFSTYRPWVLAIRGVFYQKMSNGMYEPVGSFPFWNEDWRKFPEPVKIPDSKIIHKEKLKNRITDKDVRYWIRKIYGYTI